MPRDRADQTHAHRRVGIDLGRSARDEARRFERLIADLAGAFVRATVDQIDAEINRWLERVGLTLGLDRSTVAQVDPTNGRANFSHGWAREGHPLMPMHMDVNVIMPWLKSKILAGETVVFSSVDELPAEAAKEVEIFPALWPQIQRHHTRKSGRRNRRSSRLWSARAGAKMASEDRRTNFISSLIFLAMRWKGSAASRNLCACAMS